MQEKRVRREGIGIKAIRGLLLEAHSRRFQQRDIYMFISMEKLSGQKHKHAGQ